MQLTGRKRIQDQTRLGGNGYPMGIVQEIEISLHKQMIYIHKPETVTKIEKHEILWDLKIQISHIVNFAGLHSKSEESRKTGQIPGLC